MTLGLTVGKFWPPHAGHDHLIRTARAQVDELVVVVCDLPGQDPTAADRAAWLADTHPDCDVRVVADIGHDDDSATWADYTRTFLPGAPEVVFTSEPYGETYAAELGCRWVCVDPDRRVVPISGTAIRAEPARHWSFLAPAVRAGMTRRVALVGAESTGTTTLARALAERYTTAWVPEYGRAYSVDKLARAAVDPDEAEWRTEEFDLIARRQQSDEDEAARAAGPLLFCDTDALATAVWHRRYVGAESPSVEAIGASRSYAAYVLTGCEIPFEQDGLRDGEHLREWMTDEFRRRLATRPEPWIEVTGSVEDRLRQVDAFLLDVLGPPWIPPPHPQM
jgi:NadR type nicotinamide-nucleotide adenylyltransferase